MGFLSLLRTGKKQKKKNKDKKHYETLNHQAAAVPSLPSAFPPVASSTKKKVSPLGNKQPSARTQQHSTTQRTELTSTDDDYDDESGWNYDVDEMTAGSLKDPSLGHFPETNGMADPPPPTDIPGSVHYTLGSAADWMGDSEITLDPRLCRRPSITPFGDGSTHSMTTQEKQQSRRRGSFFNTTIKESDDDDDDDDGEFSMELPPFDELRQPTEETKNKNKECQQQGFRYIAREDSENSTAFSMISL